MSGYSQNDPSWSRDFLGTSNYWTVGAAGCLITAGCDVLRAFGHDITPGDLNHLATQNGLIDSNGDVTRPDWLSILFPDVLQFVEAKDWGSSLADLHYFDIRNDLNTEIILMIDDSPAAGMQTHFMRTVGWDGGNDVIVDDSWDSIRKGVNAYGQRWNPAVHAAAIIYKAYKFVRYVAPVTPPVEIPPVQEQPPVVETPPVVVPEPPVVPEQPTDPITPPVVIPPVQPPADQPTDPVVVVPPVDPPVTPPVTNTPVVVITPSRNIFALIIQFILSFFKRSPNV